MKPEEYHLTEGIKIREKVREEIAKIDKAVNAALEKKARAYVKSIGFNIPAGAEFKHGDRFFIRKEGIDQTIEITHSMENRLREEVNKEMPTEMEKREQLSNRRRALCDSMKVSGAREFGAFVRIKYGKDASLEVVAKAHDEWIAMKADCTC